MATKMFAGLIRTDITTGDGISEIFQRIEKITPLGRLTEIQNVMDLVLFLLRDQPVMITGINNLIDGAFAKYGPSTFFRMCSLLLKERTFVSACQLPS